MPEEHPSAVMLVWCMSHTLCSVLTQHVTAMQCAQATALHSCHPTGSSFLRAATLCIVLHFLRKRITSSSRVLSGHLIWNWFLLFCSKRRGAEQEEASPQLVPACGTGQALGKFYGGHILHLTPNWFPLVPTILSKKKGKIKLFYSKKECCYHYSLKQHTNSYH